MWLHPAFPVAVPFKMVSIFLCFSLVKLLQVTRPQLGAFPRLSQHRGDGRAQRLEKHSGIGAGRKAYMALLVCCCCCAGRGRAGWGQGQGWGVGGWGVGCHTQSSWLPAAQTKLDREESWGFSLNKYSFPLKQKQNKNKMMNLELQ